MENSMEVSQKTKNKAVIWSNNSTDANMSEENKNTNLKKYKHSNVYNRIIYNNKNVETN